jgi:hypothetical protein
MMHISFCFLPVMIQPGCQFSVQHYWFILFFFLYKVFSIIREFCSLGLFGQLNKSARSPEEYTDIHPRICVQQATQKSDIDIWVMYAITLTGIPYTSNTGSVLNQQIIAEITP